MKILASMMCISCILSCNNIKEDTAHKDRTDWVPEPDRNERLRYEALQELQNSGCSFPDPDTSVRSINIRDTRSGEAIIKNDQMDDSDQYHYYSKSRRQVLTLTKHAGDPRYSISIFKVAYARSKDSAYRQLDIDEFKTGKGIGLGMSKSDIVGRLGNCYAALDSVKDYIELYYRIEFPKDTRTGLLASHNMPIYYASYIFRNDSLQTFEFGFEYP